MRLPMKPRRTALYLPASNEKALAKARSLDADVVILDLEDAVAPDAKVAARAAAVAAAREGSFGNRELVIRVNGLDTEWGRDDLAAAASSGAHAVLVPKIGNPDDIACCDQLLRDAPPALALWAMMETCAAVMTLGPIAAAARDSRLAAFVLGTNDLAKEMRARATPERTAFLPILTLVVAAARSEGLVVLDGVCNDFRDLDAFAAECRQGLMLGFDGKTIIHPAQIEPCNSIFAPTDAEISWADALIAAFTDPANAQKGVLQVEGKMVELLHLEEARRVRETAQILAARAVAN